MSKKGTQNLALQNLTLKAQVKELAEAVNFLKVRDEAYQRLTFSMLHRLGGSFETSDEEIDLAEGRIVATVDKEKKTTTFSIELPPEA